MSKTEEYFKQEVRLEGSIKKIGPLTKDSKNRDQIIFSLHYPTLRKDPKTQEKILESHSRQVIAFGEVARTISELPESTRIKVGGGYMMGADRELRVEARVIDIPEATRTTHQNEM